MFFDELVVFRLQSINLKMIKKICRKDPDRYDNESRFFRVAVLKLMREERIRLFGDCVLIKSNKRLKI